LESPEGEIWSRQTHNTHGCRVSLVSFKLDEENVIEWDGDYDWTEPSMSKWTPCWFLPIWTVNDIPEYHHTLVCTCDN
jgi:hypothetical protein